MKQDESLIWSKYQRFPILEVKWTELPEIVMAYIQYRKSLWTKEKLRFPYLINSALWFKSPISFEHEEFKPKSTDTLIKLHLAYFLWERTNQKRSPAIKSLRELKFMYTKTYTLKKNISVCEAKNECILIFSIETLAFAANLLLYKLIQTRTREHQG